MSILPNFRKIKKDMREQTREMMKKRYAEGASMEQIAVETGYSYHMVYRVIKNQR